MAKGSYNYIPGTRTKAFRVGDSFSIDVGTGDDRVSYSEADFESMSNSEVKKLLPNIRSDFYIPRDPMPLMDIAGQYDNPQDRIQAVMDVLNTYNDTFNKDENDAEGVRVQHVAFFNADGYPLHVGLGKGSTVGIPLDSVDSAPTPYMGITNSRYMDADANVLGGLPDMSTLIAPAFGIKKIYTTTNSRGDDGSDLWVIDAENVKFKSEAERIQFRNRIQTATARSYAVEDPVGNGKQMKIAQTEAADYKYMIDKKEEWINAEAQASGISPENVKFSPSKEWADTVKNEMVLKRIAAYVKVSRTLGFAISRVKKDSTADGVTG